MSEDAALREGALILLEAGVPDPSLDQLHAELEDELGDDKRRNQRLRSLMSKVDALRELTEVQLR